MRYPPFFRACDVSFDRSVTLMCFPLYVSAFFDRAAFNIQLVLNSEHLLPALLGCDDESPHTLLACSSGHIVMVSTDVRIKARTSCLPDRWATTEYSQTAGSSFSAQKLNSLMN